MRSKVTWLGGVVATVMLTASLPAHAFRCGTKIIGRGDHVTKLLHYCGEPASVQQRLAQRSVAADFGSVFIPGYAEEVVVEEWTYNFGPHQLLRLVRLENGVVTEIRYLGYGY